MSIEKHNRWSRVVPSGVTLTDLKNRLRITSLTERERSVCRLVLDTAEPEHFTVTVKFIADSIGFSAARAWPKVRDLLIARGILTSKSERMGGGQHRWHLDFDFTPVASGLFDKPSQLSTTDTKKGESRARACDPPKKEGSRDPTLFCGSRDPTRNGGYEPEALDPEKTTSKAVLLFLKGLKKFTDDEKNRIMFRLGEAEARQLDAFMKALAKQVEGATSRVGLAIHLAKLASRGKLDPAANTTPTETASPKIICDAHSDWSGELVDPEGVVARASASDSGQVRDVAGRLFSIADSAKFWQKICDGELSFVDG